MCEHCEPTCGKKNIKRFNNKSTGRQCGAFTGNAIFFSSVVSGIPQSANGCALYFFIIMYIFYYGILRCYEKHTWDFGVLK